MIYNAIDLFSGCGGLTEGMRQAGFDVKVAIDNNHDAVLAYRMNHPRTEVIPQDIRTVDSADVAAMLGDGPLHLLAGCPPCQGFSGLRRLNRKRSVRDRRNSLILSFYRFVEELRPLTIMMENVAGLADYYLFRKMKNDLERLGYALSAAVVDVQNYGVPQRRKRLVLVGSRLGEIDIARATGERKTVRQTIGNLEPIEKTNDPLQKITVRHTKRVEDRISLTPKDGGSRSELPEEYELNCHSRKNVGFRDIYGRLRWNSCSGTITSGCLNPSKGRFLHPEQDRVITPREASLLQSFPPTYVFPLDIPKYSLAKMIGEALPPKFSYVQCRNIKLHLDGHLGR